MKMDNLVQILLVENDREHRNYIASLCKLKGFNVNTASNGKEALEKAYKKSFDLVITAIKMPEMDGLEMIRLIKMIDPSVVVIVISDNRDVEVMKKSMVSGAFDLLFKPIRKQDFIISIDRAYEHRKLVVENVRHNKALEQLVARRTRDLFLSFEAAIFGFAKLVEYRDSETGFHLERLSDYSAVVSEKMSFLSKYKNLISYSYISHIRRSVLLHDIGKVGIPDRILLKPGKLTKNEFEIIKYHTVIGASALKEMQQKLGNKAFFNMGMLIANFHHERWDGKGYPEGLEKTQIPLSARIVAIADVFDALTSERPYKKAFSISKAIDIIKAERGQHFDPNVVDSFLDSMDEIIAIHDKWKKKKQSGSDMVNQIMPKVNDLIHNTQSGSKKTIVTKENDYNSADTEKTIVTPVLEDILKSYSKKINP